MQLSTSSNLTYLETSDLGLPLRDGHLLGSLNCAEIKCSSAFKEHTSSIFQLTELVQVDGEAMR